MLSLSEAARFGRNGDVKQILRSGADVNARDMRRDGNTALIEASANGHLGIVQLLLAHNSLLNGTILANIRTSPVKLHRALTADVNLMNFIGETALMVASSGGYQDIVELLLSHGANAYLKDNNGTTAQMLASRRGYQRIVDLLSLEHLLEAHTGAGKSINSIDPRIGTTFIHRAADEGNLPLVQRISALGGDLNIRNSDGCTALLLASKKRRTDVVRFLCSMRTVDKSKQDKDGNSPLHEAALLGYTDIVSVLCSVEGISVNSKNQKGHSPLHDAALLGHKDIVFVLCSVPSLTPNLQNKSGRTAIHLAAKTGKVEVVAMLCSHSGIDPNVQDQSGSTALHRAVKYRQLDVIRCMASLGGVSSNLKDFYNGHTPLHRAILDGRLDVIELLCSFQGIDINVKTTFGGYTALQYAKYYKRTALVEFLLSIDAFAKTQRESEAAAQREREVLAHMGAEVEAQRVVAENEGVAQREIDLGRLRRPSSFEMQHPTSSALQSPYPSAPRIELHLPSPTAPISLDELRRRSPFDLQPPSPSVSPFALREDLAQKESEAAAQRDWEITAQAVSSISGSGPCIISYGVISKWCDHFSVDRQVGEGGFSDVFRGIFVANSAVRSVIVKRLECNELTASELVSSMKKEINILNAFLHPNLIRLIGHAIPAVTAGGAPEHPPCLVFEDGSRGGLQLYLSSPLLTPAKRLHIIAGIACGLNYLHSKSSNNPVLHRDMKSANVVLTEGWTPKLIDFGVSSYDAAADTTRTFRAHTLIPTRRGGGVYGTPGYICPVYLSEFSRSRDPVYTFQSDIFSFGIVMLEVCFEQLQGAGHIPLQDIIDDLRNHRVWKEYPQCAEELIYLSANCTASLLKDRFPAMTAVSRRLNELARAVPVSALEGQLNNLERDFFDSRRREELARALRERPVPDAQLCMVCLEQFPPERGVLCSDDGHFLCDGCFNSEVSRQIAGENYDRFVSSEGFITCAWCLATTPPVVSRYADQAIIMHTSAVAGTAYRNARGRLVATQMEIEFQDRLPRDTGENECCVCMANPSNTALVPCGHLCICSECAETLDREKCPICRSEVEDTVRVYRA